MALSEWHCAQIPNGDHPVVVCERSDLLAEVYRLRAELASASPVLEAARRVADAVHRAEATRAEVKRGGLDDIEDMADALAAHAAAWDERHAAVAEMNDAAAALAALYPEPETETP